MQSLEWHWFLCKSFDMVHPSSSDLHFTSAEPRNCCLVFTPKLSFSGHTNLQSSETKPKLNPLSLAVSACPVTTAQSND